MMSIRYKFSLTWYHGWIMVMVLLGIFCSVAPVHASGSGYSTFFSGPMVAVSDDALHTWTGTGAAPESGNALAEWQIQTDKDSYAPGDIIQVTLDMHLSGSYGESGSEKVKINEPTLISVYLDTSGLTVPLTFDLIDSFELEGIGDDYLVPNQVDNTITRILSFNVPEDVKAGTYSLYAYFENYKTNNLDISISGEELLVTPEVTKTPTSTPNPKPTIKPASTPSGSHAPGVGSTQVELSITGPYDSESGKKFYIRPGEILTQTYSAKNTGSSETGNFVLKFYLGVNKDKYLGEIQISSLSPSQSKSGQASFTIPSDTPDGEYSSYLEAVKDGKVIGACRSWLPLWVQKGGGDKPDLIPMVLTISKPDVSGQPFTLTCTVKNQGSITSGPCQIAFYLSTEKTVPSGTPVFATGSLGSLSVGNTLQVSGTASAPESAYSEYFYPVAKVDSSNQITETAENNNIIVGEGFDIQPGGGVNLIPLITSATVSGDKKTLSVAYSVRNSGQVSSSGGTLTFSLISADSGVQSVTFDSIPLPSIQANGVHSGTVKYTPVVETGDYYVRGTIELSSDINQGDNTYTTQKTIHIEGSGSLPEFSTLLSKAPSSAKAGDTISLQNIVYNTGSADANGVYVGVYLSMDSQIRNSDTRIGSHQYDNIFHDYYAYKTLSVTIPVGTQPGTWYLGAIVDPDNAIPEKDEGNNRSDPISIQILGSSEKPVAGFDATPVSGIAPLTVSFTDTSTGNPSTWSWDFGDTSALFSEPDPVHTYTLPGSYTVILTVSNPSGSSSATKSIAVNKPVSELVAGFDAAPLSGDAPLKVTFTDTSTGNPSSWSWDFGDGSSGSSEKSPSHIFQKEGSYIVTLTVSNEFGSDKISQNIIVNKADESVKPEALAGVSQKDTSDPFTFRFADYSYNPGGTRVWDFGDGTSSTEAFTTHTYTKPGTYKIILTVKNSVGSDTDEKWARVTDTSLPVVPTADFTFSPSSGPVPLTVQFTDKSQGDPTAWSWEFGDKTTSDEKNPVHIFTGENSPLSISVKLTVSNNQGSNFKIIEDAIQIRAAKEVDYTISVDGQNEITSGTEYNFPTTISTIGDGYAQQVNVRYYLSEDAVYQIDKDTFLAQMYGFGADPGTSMTKTASFSIPESVTPGSYYLIAYVNQGKEAVESDYSNNVGVLPVTLGPSSQAASPPPSPTKTTTPELVQASNEVSGNYIGVIGSEQAPDAIKATNTISFTISPDNSVSGTMKWEYLTQSNECTGDGTFSGTYDPSSQRLVMECTDGKYQCSNTEGPAIATILVEVTRSGDGFSGTATSIWKDGEAVPFDYKAVRT